MCRLYVAKFLFGRRLSSGVITRESDDLNPARVKLLKLLLKLRNSGTNASPKNRDLKNSVRTAFDLMVRDHEETVPSVLIRQRKLRRIMPDSRLCSGRRAGTSAAKERN